MFVMKLNDVYKPNNHYKVIIKTITYNHSKYIQDTLNGVAIQETNFPFVNIVLEDHSTDGEQDVIRLWLERECNMSLAEHYDIPTADVIIAPHKSNKNCSFAVYFHKENLFHQKDKREAQLYPWRIISEYEALCEGDDYWIDSLKLQKQVDFLDRNVAYSCCHTAFNCVDFKGDIIKREDYEKKNLISGNGERFWFTMLVENYILTCTFMMRCKFSLTLPIGYHDYGIFLHNARQGYVGFLPERMSCYRQTPGSIMNDSQKLLWLNDAFKRITVKEILNILEYADGTIEEVYNYPKKKRAIARLLIMCINTNDSGLRKSIRRIYLRRPMYLFLGVFYKLIKKNPCDFYVDLESSLK